MSPEPSPSPPLRAGFVGLGNQGTPIAERIVAHGFQLAVWARRPEAAAPLVAQGATFVPDPYSLGAASDIVGVCVGGDDDVRQVVLGEGTGIAHGMRPGGVVVVHSTVAPQTVRELQDDLHDLGIAVLDAPVSGGERGARRGELTLMVGGDAEVLGRCRPVLETYGGLIAHLGALGAGQLAKLLNNNLQFATMTLAIASLDLAERLGLDRQLAAEVMRGGTANSVSLTVLDDDRILLLMSRMDATFAKDLHHFEDALALAGVTDDELVPLGRQMAERLRAYTDARFTARGWPSD